MENKVKWDIEQIDDSRYRLELNYISNDSIFKQLLTKSAKKVNHKLNLSINIDYDTVETFSIPEERKDLLFPVIINSISRHLKQVKKSCKEDGFIIITEKIEDIYYIKTKTDGWRIIIIIGGVYNFQ